jgi:putative ABC transport system permease protein
VASLKALLNDFWALFHRDRIDQEVADELRFHIELRIQESIAAGMSAEEARRDAIERFGGFERVRETCREIRGAALLEAFAQDAHYGSRMLLKGRVVTLAAVLALGLGVGATTAIFSVVNTVLLRPLPYREPDRLVWITQSLPRFKSRIVTGADFLEWAKQHEVFEYAAAFSSRNFNLTQVDTPERLSAGLVSAEFFPMLGVQPLLGRAFLPEEDRPGRNNVVLLSHDLWRRRFGGDQSVVGKAVTLDGERYTVLGVLPQGFHIFGQYDVWAPLALDPVTEFRRQRMSIVWAMARLKPGATMEQARAQVSTVAKRMEQQYPQGYQGVQVMVLPLHERLVGNLRLSILALFGAGGFVLLIACANVANLLLGRGLARVKEIAIRAALGADRLRLVRQFLTESILLGVLGGTTGLLLATWAMHALVALIPSSLPGAQGVKIDYSVLVFALLLSLATGVFFGLAPAFATTKIDLSSTLKEGGGSPVVRVGPFRFRNLLVIGELALTLVLLVGAGLMVRSFVRLRDVNPGFRPQNVLSMAIELPRSKYPEPARQAAFFREVLHRVQTLPGVQSAATTSQLPMAQGMGDQALFSIEGEPAWAPEEGAQRLVNQLVVSSDYFRTMGIPLVKGNCFTDRDMQENSGKVLINESLARRFFPGKDPLGKRLKLGFPEGPEPWLSIVGVAGDVRLQTLEDEAGPAIYMSYLEVGDLGSARLVVRGAVDPNGLALAVATEVRSVDKNQPVYDMKTMEERLEASVAPRRFKTLLLGIFATMALLLAGVGIYGVMSYSVAQRTHEIGVRMALGANSSDVLRTIVGEAGLLVVLGIALGLAGAMGLTHLLAGLLYGLKATDPVTLMAVSLLLSGVALLASYFPARKAAAVDPVVALREN